MEENKLPCLYLVIPCYNEEAVLHETSRRLKALYAQMIGVQISKSSRILFVNDGSKDKTWEIISQLHQADPVFGGVNLTRNRGHQNALLAGMMTAKQHADIVISMDADLQDDPNAAIEMVQKYREGCDIVYGVRSSREKDTAFKRGTAQSYYRLMAFLGVDIVYNHADYRLMSKRALDALEQYGEVNLFLRGIVPQLGYQTDIVYYERGERFAGESKYPLKKMLAFAFDGITSFSIKPVRMISVVGVIVSVVGLIYLIYCLIRNLTGNTIEGWTSIIGSVWLIGGIQLVALGVIGEYIGKIYYETKRRPRYLIESVLLDSDDAQQKGASLER
jgi:glycosyltransferase involved in cell wall biosynthesis